ncbi:NAD-dependent malic enzyme [Thaumasiovibrio sp. DFM-14]|uniref:NAD-dependent malic enzyme n=1 Tax=Thaumasiovibrio sp. DFM-14 TaxID=3384792 RepID=UPI0039A34773
MTEGKYLRWKDENGNEFRPVSISGTDLLNDRTLNKSTAFTYEERKAFGLNGLLPPRVQSFEDQVNRVYAGFANLDEDMEKYQYLRALQDRNETLFYALLSRYIDEMMPIIYTPTVGKACQQFSHRYQTARGLYVTEDNVDNMTELARHFQGKDIRIIVVTDSQGILGIGDQGVGGMAIPIGKLSLYTLGAGIHPAHCLPIALDVGTDNQDLLNDPMYLGEARKRMKGKEYHDFIAKFIMQVQRCFPRAVLQWEDFSKSNAFDNLVAYHDTLPSFNDDIQGTGAVTLAGILAAMRTKKQSLSEQFIAIYGAGAGGVGIADQIYAGLLKEGRSQQDAKSRIFVADSQGVIFDDRDNLDDYKRRFAQPASLKQAWGISGAVSLDDLLEKQKITVLVGASGVGGSFQQQHIKALLNHDPRPIVMPLSNPTANCEALPEDIIRWSKGQALVATGSPFSDVSYEGKNYRIGQGNNVFIFPGVGLAAIVAQLQTINLDVFTTAAYALADCVSDADIEEGCVFPPVNQLREISLLVAKRILQNVCIKEPGCSFCATNIEELLEENIWDPVYLPYRRV